MLRLSFRLFITLLLVLPLAACDSDSGDDDDGGGGSTIGSATITVSGGFSDSFSGSAVFGVDEDENVFSLGIFEGDLPTTGTFSGALIALSRDESGRPAEGTYSIDPSGPSSFNGGYISDFSSLSTATFVSASSGTLTITSSSSDRVAGTFTFTGIGSNSTGTELGEVTVEGSFSAEFASNIPSTSFP